MPVHNQRGHLHAAPPLLEVGGGFRAEAAVRILDRASGGVGKQMGKLTLLGGNLDQQALAQIAGADAGRVKLLHHADGAAEQLKQRFRGRRRSFLELEKAAASSSSLPVRYPSPSRLPMTNSTVWRRPGSRVRDPNCHAR